MWNNGSLYHNKNRLLLNFPYGCIHAVPMGDYFVF